MYILHLPLPVQVCIGVYLYVVTLSYVYCGVCVMCCEIVYTNRNKFVAVFVCLILSPHISFYCTRHVLLYSVVERNNIFLDIFLVIEFAYCIYYYDLFCY